MAAGWPGHAQNAENGCRPAALLQQVPSGSKCLAGGQKQAGCPGPAPSHLLP